MDFEPFPVVCVTCGSKLRVNRRELVDAIVKCPKCQSLVQLSRPTSESPAQPVALGDLSVDTGAVTEDSIAAPAVDPSATSSSAPPVFTDSPEADSSGSNESTGEFDDSPPPANWQDTGTAKTRRIAAIVAASVIGLFALAVLISLIVRSGDSAPQASTMDGAASDTPPDETEPEGESPDAETEDETPDAKPAENPAAKETSETAEEASKSTDSDASVSETDMNQAETSEAIPADLLPTDPLLPDNPLLPDVMIPGAGPSGKQDELPQDVTELTELPPELAELFDGISGVGRAQFPNAAPPPPTIDEFEVDQAAQVQMDGERTIDAPKPLNMREALGLSVALQTGNPDGYPLNDLLLRISQLSGVPIEVQWVSMEISGIELNGRVAIPKGWLSLEAILDSVCQSTGCVYEAKPNSIEVRPDDDAFAARLAELMDLSDVNAPPAVLSARRLLGQDDSKSDRVDLPDDLGQQQIAVLVCEMIRRLNGVEGKMSDSAFARWSGPLSQQVGGWPLLKDSPIGKVESGRQMVQAGSVASLLIRFAKANDATCFVNWADAAKSGLRPIDHRMPQTGPGIPMGKAVEQIFEDSYLQVRQIDDGYWWVGSESSFDRFPVVLWLEDTDLNSSAERTRQLIESMLKGSDAEGSVTVDAASGKCIAILPRFLVRQVPRLLSGEGKTP